MIFSRFFSQKPLWLALSVAFSSASYAEGWVEQKAGLCFRQPEQAEGLAKAKGIQADLPADTTRITANQVDGQTQMQHHAQGQVVVEHNQEVLNADWINYQQQTGVLTAGDKATLTRANGQTIRGKDWQYNLLQHSGLLKEAEFESEENGRRLQGMASQLEMQDKQRMRMTDVQFNTCLPGDKSWYVQASEVSINQETGVGVARHARLVFAGVPILYTPWADFPINGHRKSGLLVPTLKTGSDGTEISLPYYFNLAPNYDTTLIPGVITARGVRLGGEFRYLMPQFSGSLNATYMPDDKRSEHNNRYEFKFNHYQQFNPYLSAGVSYHQVSDDDYYRDFYGRNDIAENVNLNRSAWLNYTNQKIGQSLSAQLLLQKYQTLSDAVGYKNKPYAILPRLSMHWYQQLGKQTEWNVLGQFTRFVHHRKQEGSRLVVYPSIQWDLRNEWLYVRPKVGVHATQYWLDAFESQSSRTVTRILPVINVNTGITLERQTQWLGKDYVQTLEPHVFYNYIPKKNQNNLPNFDSSENDFSYEQLFRENIYSGNDRINASNSLAIGLQTRYLRREDGRERFRAGIGQKFYFNHDDVLLDGSISKNIRNSSDVVAFAGGWLHDNWYADTHWHWDQSNRQNKRFGVGVRYNPQQGKVISARFKYGRQEEIYTGFYGKLKHAQLAAQWPLKPNIYVVGNLNYSIKSWAALEQTLGVEYRSPCGCWSVSLVGQRYVNGLDSYKKAFFLTLQLKDLSSLGNNPYEQLRLGVPGYTKINEVSK